MAGGAPSAASAALARAAKEQQRMPGIDPTAIPPRTIEQFTTGRVNLVQHDEERDENDNITRAASVELHMIEAGTVALAPTPEGDMAITAVGGTERVTKFLPELAIQIGEAMVEHGKLAQESMEESPLPQNGKVMPATPADVGPVAAAAAAAAGFKGS